VSKQLGISRVVLSSMELVIFLDRRRRAKGSGLNVASITRIYSPHESGFSIFPKYLDSYTFLKTVLDVFM
jgi:hypothetical protein